MRKKKIILVLISLIIFSKSYAQNYFNKLDSTSFYYHSVGLRNDTIYVLGEIWNNGLRSVNISKHNQNGNLIFLDTLSGFPVMTSTAIMLLTDELYITSIYSNTPPFESSSRDIMLTNYNEGIGWQRIYGGNDTEQPREILKHEDYIYILGTTNSFGEGLGDFYLIKVDTIGNVIWEKTYGSPKNEIAFSISLTKNGTLFLSGHKKISGSDWDIYLVKIDTAGNLLWEKNYGTPWNDYFGGSSSTYDHSHLVYRNELRTSQNSRSGFLEKLDGMGNIIWSKEFAQNNYSVFDFTVPVENEDGTIMIVNHVKNNNGNLIIKLYKLDPFGNILWTKEYFKNPNIPHYIYDIKPTPDGGYIMCGSAFPINSNKQHAWLVKTNCNGEEGIQYPITNTPCDQYDCTQYPIDANFTASNLTVDLVNGGDITFENSSSNTTSRVWNFGDGNKAYTDSLVSHTFTQEGIYDVQLIVFHAKCSDTFSLQIEVTNTLNVSTLALLNQKVNVFPNPNNGNFTLQNNTKDPIDMIIYDGMGKVIHRQKAEKVTNHINLNVNKGVYFMKIMQNGTSVIKKIVVN